MDESLARSHSNAGHPATDREGAGSMGDVLDVVHERHAQRVIFGVGSARTRLADEVQRPNDARIRLGAGDAERAVTERPVDRESAKELLRGAWAGWSVLRGHGHRGRGDDLDT